MIDLKYLINNLEAIKKNLSQRKFDISILDNLNTLNDARKKLTTSSENLRSQINTLSKTIGELKKNKQDATDLLNEVSVQKDIFAKESEELNTITKNLNDLLLTIPNILDESVPHGESNADNKILLQWGTIPSFDFKVLDHVELGEKLKLLEMSTAGKLSGARFAFYLGDLARLERALYNFMLDEHYKNGYQEAIVPVIVNSETMTGTGQLPKFKEDLFKIEGHDSYLISTAEIPLTNVRRDTIFSYDELPFKLCAITPCFRSEAGSYGKDTRGLIRLHQFNKVELVNIVSPDDSEVYHRKMADAAASILQKLNLAYQEVLLCSADIGFCASKCIDLEVWLPSQNCYREISSISNCKTFQSTRAQMRYRDKDKNIIYPHTINGSGLAVGRTLVAVMENYQQKDGSILIPDILVNYMNGQTIIKSNA